MRHDAFQAIQLKLKEIEAILSEAITDRIDLGSAKPTSDKSLPTDAYSTEAALALKDIYPLIQTHRHQIAAYFYNNLDERSHELLKLLSKVELDALRHGQMSYLAQLFAPDLSRQQHEQLAQEAGKRHDMVSLDPQALLDSYHVYWHAITLYIPELEALPSARQTMETRLHNDMAWQMMGYLHASNTRTLFLEQLLNALQQAHNRDALLDAVFEILLEVPGISGVSLCTITGQQNLLCEKARGLVLYFETCEQSHDPKTSPLFQAWKTEKPLWGNSLKDLEHSCLNEDAQDLGIRSYAILPVFNDQGAPDHLLIIYGQYPGYFLNESKRFFFKSIAREIGIHLELLRRYQRTFSFSVPISLTQRQRYRQLLENERVTMLYQPIVDTERGQVKKIEALARLKGPDDTLIPPAKFLQALGPNHLIHLFEQGANQLCETLSCLEKQHGIQINGSINMPTEAFDHPECFSRLREIVRAHQLQPQRITIEILESGFLDENQANQGVEQLKTAGFRLAMDDMGSGESSLLRLRKLDVDEVKIDQAFVRPLTNKLENLDFLDTLIQLSENLNLACVVEGVENATIIDVVKALGGNTLTQGYGIALPMEKGKLTQWLKAATKNKHAWQNPLPQTLYGWYAAHFRRMRIITNALNNDPDLLNLSHLRDETHCPMTQYLLNLGYGPDSLLFKLHEAFHETINELAQIQRKPFPQAYQQTLQHLYSLAAQMRKEVLIQTQKSPLF